MYDQNVSNKIAFITGAGAVENGWLPVLEAIKSQRGVEVDGDGANSVFARLIYLLRFYYTGTYPGSKKHGELLLEEVNSLKDEIAVKLTTAELNRSIQVRREFKEILDRFVFSELHKFVLLTTNWDTIIDKTINELGESNYPYEGSYITSLHIHGTITSPAELYLPSEIVREPYRSKEGDLTMGNTHGTAWRAIEGSNITILYGLSLDPLDAELCQTLAAGWSSSCLKEIIIINPEHKKIAQRAKLLLDPRHPAKITGYDPSNLTQKNSY